MLCWDAERKSGATDWHSWSLKPFWITSRWQPVSKKHINRPSCDHFGDIQFPTFSHSSLTFPSRASLCRQFLFFTCSFPPTTHLSHHDSHPHPHPFPSLFSPGSSTLSSGNTPSLSVSSRPARRKRVLNPSLVPDARGAFWTMSSSGDTSSCAVALLRKLSRASWISAQKICSSALLTAA